MSMAAIAYTHNGQTRVAFLHYRQATLDWGKYHAEQVAYYHGTPPDSDYWWEYWRKEAAFHEQAAQGFVPDINLGGCEKDAGERGFWQVDSDKAAAAWVDYADQHPIPRLPENCPCHIDFDRKEMTVHTDPTDNPFCRWEKYLPDGWSARLV